VVKWIAREKLDTTLVTHSISPIEDEVCFLTHLYEGKKAIEEKERLSREYSKSGAFEKRRRLHEYPDWLDREEDVVDID